MNIKLNDLSDDFCSSMLTNEKSELQIYVNDSYLIVQKTTTKGNDN